MTEVAKGKYFWFWTYLIVLGTIALLVAGFVVGSDVLVMAVALLTSLLSILWIGVLVYLASKRAVR